MRLIAGANQGGLRTIDQSKSVLASIIAEDKKRKYEEEQARVKRERLAIAQANEQAAIEAARKAGSKTGIALETAKGVGSRILDMGLALARSPLTVPLKVTQTLVEGATGKPQVYTPQTGVEKFFYGSDPIQSYTGDQRSIQKFAEEKGLSKGASIAAGAVGAGSEAALDVSIPGIGKALSKTFIGRAVSKLRGTEVREITASEVHNTVNEVVDTVGRNITPDEKTAVINALSSGSSKEQIVKAVEKSSQEASKTAENITSWLSGAPKSFDEKTVSSLRKERLGVDELTYDKDGNITLYRDGRIENGKPQSYSLTKIDDRQVAYTVNKSDVLINFNGEQVKDFMVENFKRGDKEIALESLDHWKNFEKEVVVIRGGEKNTKVSAAGESESPILKEVNKSLEEESKVNPNLPTTTFKKQFSMAEKEIKKDPAKAYNDALNVDGDEMTKSSLQLMLLRNAINKADDKAIAELGTAAARTGRKAGQTAVMFRALYDKDPMSRMLMNFVRSKLTSIESRFPRSIRKSLEEGGDVITRTGKSVRKKAQIKFQDAQSIIDQFICK